MSFPPFIFVVFNSTKSTRESKEMARPTQVLRSASAQASAALRERVRRPALLSKLAKPEDLAPLFKNGDSLCVSTLSILLVVRGY